MDTIRPLRIVLRFARYLAFLFLLDALSLSGQNPPQAHGSMPPQSDVQPANHGPVDPESISEIQRLSEDLNRLVKTGDYTSAAKPAAQIWKTVVRLHITDRDIQSLPHVLSVIVDLCLHSYDDVPTAVRVLKYMVELPGSHTVTNNKATDFEWAADKLGRTYYDAGCQRNASYWLQQATDFARSRNLPSAANRDFIMGNLWLLANSKGMLGDPTDELKYNREILQFVGEHPSSNTDLKYLVQIGRAEVRYGDFDLGIRLLDTFRHQYKPATDEEMTYTVQAYLAEGYAQLDKKHYAAIDQLAQEGLQMLGAATNPAFSKGKIEWRNILYALTARSLIRQGRFEDAENEIFKVYKAEDVGDEFFPAEAIGNITLLEDLARIYVHFNQFNQAFPAYISLARHYGELIGDPRRAPTPRTRLFWLSQENTVVQELVSVWLSMPESAEKKKWEASIANTLLQTKANLFLAATEHRAIAYHQYSGLDTELFSRNHNYAKAAIQVWDDPSDANAWSEMEDAFLVRETFEAAMVASPMELQSTGSSEYAFDFQKLFDSDSKTALLDYSLIDFTYPKDGLPQPASKRIFVGVKITSDSAKIVALGKEDEIAAKVKPFLEDVTRRPRPGEDMKSLLLDGSAAFNAIVAPLGDLPKSVYVAAEGFLSAVPFPALVDGNQFLVESHDIWINHSPLMRRHLNLRQQGLGADMYDNSAVVLIGDPDYAGTNLVPLAGTKKEIEDVQHLFSMNLASPVLAHAKVKASTGPDANAHAILSSPHPLILHIAAHGEFWPGDINPNYSVADDPYNPEPELMEGPLGPLDDALLRSSIILSPGTGPAPAPEERRITALELSSLNLLGTNLLILSACDTGRGIDSQAAGVLGFQYAAQTTMVRYAMLSLWEIDDNSSATVVSSIYRKWLLDNQSISDAYTKTLRELSRDHGLPVHPFYWAPFILMKQDY